MAFHIFFIAMYLGVAFWPVSLEAKSRILGVAYAFPPVIAVIGTSAVFIKKRADEGLFWGTLALSMIAITAGELYWLFLQVFRGLSHPALASFATYAFLTGYVFLFLSIFAFWWISRKRIQHLYSIFVTIALMISTAAAVWFFQYQTTYVIYFQQSMYDELINAIYPALDVALLVGFISTAVFSNAPKWPSWVMAVITGIALYAVGDMAFTFFSVADAYQPGTLVSNVIDVFWMACYMFIFFGAFLRLMMNDEEYSGVRI